MKSKKLTKQDFANLKRGYNYLSRVKIKGMDNILKIINDAIEIENKTKDNAANIISNYKGEFVYKKTRYGYDVYIK